MKALQAKRDSFRSLWKGSLVVLSILALAFVFGCDNSSSSGSPGPRPVDPGPVIVDFELIRHPQTPSFQGVAPVLDGMMVRFTYSDGTAVTIDDPKQFRTIIPGHGAEAEFHRFEWPVARPGEGELPTAREAQRTVMVSHIGSGFVLNVVVPEVLPLHSVHQAGAGLAPSGQRYYEDELWPFLPETHGLRLIGNYLTNPGVNMLTIEREIPVLQNPGYFRIIPDSTGAEKHKAAYIVSNWFDGMPIQEAPWAHAWDIDKIWWIDRVTFDGFTGSPSEARIFADAYAFFKDENDPAEAEAYWLDALEKLGARFNVYYYGYTGGPKVRTIAQYKAARAWDGSRADARPELGSTITGVPPALHQSTEETITLALQYFTNDAVLLGREVFGWFQVSQNTMLIPLTEQGLVFLHAGMDFDWKPGFTDQHDGAEALLYGQSRDDLVDALMLYWDVFHVYVNPNNANDTFRVNVTSRDEWLSAAGRANEPRFINSYQNNQHDWSSVTQGNRRFEFDEQEDAVAYSALEFAFALPRSVQTNFALPPNWKTDASATPIGEVGELALPFRILLVPPLY